MDTQFDICSTGAVNDRYRAFLETVTQLRPRLHRYCARMTGSIMDGEDLVQDTLFEAYRKLDQYDDSRPLTPWIFRIAHNRCIDHLRKRGVREEAEAAVAVEDKVLPVDPPGRALGHAVERLVIHLPPKERACVLLKDVFDYTLLEIADLIDSTEGGVKSALNRGRTKLATMPRPQPPIHEAPPELLTLLHLYVEKFNRGDWDGLRDLISADARLLFHDGYAGRLGDAPYFSKYESSPILWRMEVGEVDGEPVLISMRDYGEGYKPHSIVRFHLANGRVVRMEDYLFCPWVLQMADLVSINGSLQTISHAISQTIS